MLVSGVGAQARTAPTASVTSIRVVTSKVRHGASLAFATRTNCDPPPSMTPADAANPCLRNSRRFIISHQPLVLGLLRRGRHRHGVLPSEIHDHLSPREGGKLVYRRNTRR